MKETSDTEVAREWMVLLISKGEESGIIKYNDDIL